MNCKHLIAPALLAGALLPFASMATSTDMDKLTTYASVMGRGIACGVDTSAASERVGSWIDRRFPPGSQDQKVALVVFMQGTQMAAQQQRNGQTPDSCSQVRRSFATRSSRSAARDTRKCRVTTAPTSAPAVHRNCSRPV